MEKAISLLGVGTEAGRDVLASLQKLAKHIPPGAVAPGVQNNAMSGIMNQQRQAGPLLAQLAGGGGGGAGGPPGGGMPGMPG